VRLTPVVEVTVSEAWGMTAPLGSATWPRSIPVTAAVDVCAEARCKGVIPLNNNGKVRQKASNRFKSSPADAKLR
jgi:hypothetical protein